MEKQRLELCDEIKSAFGSVHFPAHRGLQASRALDDDADLDSTELASITKERDFHGEWWEVPFSELGEYVFGLSYLDESGIEFYLPAYLIRTLTDLDYRNFNELLYALDPVITEEDDELRKWFNQQFSKITGEKKRVCKRYLELLLVWLPSDSLRVEAFWLDLEISRVERILRDNFWNDSDAG